MRAALRDWVRGPLRSVGLMALGAALVLVGFSLGLWAGTP